MAIPANVIASIVNGEWDEDLDRLIEAIKSRRKEASAKQATVNKLTLMPGAKVKLQGLSPAYLNGMTGTVVEEPGFRRNRRKATLSVKLDHAVGRYGAYGAVTVPANCLVAID